MFGFQSFVRSIADFEIVTVKIIRPLAWGILLAEAAVAWGFARPGPSRSVFVGALLLLALFTIALCAAYRGRKQLQCSCFGESGTNTRLSWAIPRNLILIALSGCGIGYASVERTPESFPVYLPWLLMDVSFTYFLLHYWNKSRKGLT